MLRYLKNKIKNIFFIKKIILVYHIYKKIKEKYFLKLTNKEKCHLFKSINKKINLFLEKENIKNKEFIPIVTTNFLKNEKNYFYGGGERYLINLINLINKLNKKSIVFQLSEKFFITKYKKNNFVIGIGINRNKWIDGIKIIEEILIKNFKNAIYSPFHLKDKFNGFSIGISHGLYHDHPNNNINWININNFFYQKLKKHNIIICVDTGFMNWIRSIDFSVFKKCYYIPNFVDLNEFKPSYNKKNIILFPRSIYKARGIHIFIKAIKKFLIKNKKYKIYISGELVEKKYLKIFNKLKKKFKNNFYFKKNNFNQIKKIYKISKIVVIPTLHSEGTSLSCLEAMSCGCVPIVTYVGGLTDIVINNFNGLIIKPDYKDLYKSLLYITKNEKKYIFLQKNSILTVKNSFSLKMWKNNWRKILKIFFNN